MSSLPILFLDANFLNHLAGNVTYDAQMKGARKLVVATPVVVGMAVCEGVSAIRQAHRVRHSLDSPLLFGTVLSGSITRRPLAHLREE